MQLSPIYRAVLTACPDLSYIINFKKKLGRGRCSWVYGLTKTGQKISRFLKKGLVRFHTWISDTQYISLDNDRLYEVSQDECTCPEWRHRVSKGQAYRHIPGLFKGYVDRCKHQVSQWLNQHDISNFSKHIKVSEYRINVAQVPDNISLIYKDYFGGKIYEVFYHPHTLIGEIEESPQGFITSTPKGFSHNFPTQESAITYLIKQAGLSAAKDIFGDDMYPEPEPKPVTPVAAGKTKPEPKRWLSLNTLSNQPEGALLGDYGNWLEPDPDWG